MSSIVVKVSISVVKEPKLYIKVRFVDVLRILQKRALLLPLYRIKKGLAHQSKTLLREHYMKMKKLLTFQIHS